MGEKAPLKVDEGKRNLSLVQKDSTAMQAELQRARDALGSAFEQAEEVKAFTNGLFAKGEWRIALCGYVGALWLLRDDPSRQRCPMLVANAFANGTTEDSLWDKRIVDIAGWLQLGNPPQAEAEALPAAQDGAKVAALCSSLLLNAAAAALKLSEFELAKAACEGVLAVDATHSKALFRLAKAHEGVGDVSKAITACTAACRADPKNREARHMLDELRKRQSDEKAMFKGKKMFGSDEAVPIV